MKVGIYCLRRIIECLIVVGLWREKGYILTEGEYKCGGVRQGMRVLFINIYAPCSNPEVVLWSVLQGSNYSNRCLIGDFNSVRFVSERKGVNTGVANHTELVRFNEFIESCNLKDIPAIGRRRYIWYRPNGTSKCRLDRVLVSDDWLAQ